MPWNSRACFGRKTTAGRHLCRVTERSFMNDTCTPNAVYNTAISSLGWAFLPLVDEKVFSRVLCTGHGIASVFFTQPTVKVESVQFHCYWWSCQSGGQQIHHWFSVRCLPSSFGSWIKSLFLAKIPDSYKSAFNRDSPGNWNIFEIIRAGPVFIVRLWYSWPQRKMSDTDGFMIVQKESLIK